MFFCSPDVFFHLFTSSLVFFLFYINPDEICGEGFVCVCVRPCVCRLVRRWPGEVGPRRVGYTFAILDKLRARGCECALRKMTFFVLVFICVFVRGSRKLEGRLRAFYGQVHYCFSVGGCFQFVFERRMFERSFFSFGGSDALKLEGASFFVFPVRGSKRECSRCCVLVGCCSVGFGAGRGVVVGRCFFVVFRA